MKSSTGRWVSGEDFFDREPELQVLESRVRDRNHVLLSGQRRMGKTSILRELGRRLEDQGWDFLFTDVEGATCPEDVIADIAEAAYPIRPISSRFVAAMGRLVKENVEEVGAGISAQEFRVKIRAGLNAGTWRRHGERLIRECSTHDKPILLVIDELPIFLKRMLREDDGEGRVEEFLSWLRGAFQRLEGCSPVLIVSGSIGLAPLVHRLGIPDRINHLYSFRLGPWSRDVSVECFKRLTESSKLSFEEGVADAVYEALGIGIPHQVQSFFARLQDFAIMQNRDHVTVEDAEVVYRTELLGPSGGIDLMHYETRLGEGLDDKSYKIAMEILAEAAVHDVFTIGARRCLEGLYSRVLADTPDRIEDALEVLVHDGYLEVGDDGYHFPSRLLKDWWAARFRNHHTSLESRFSNRSRGGVQ